MPYHRLGLAKSTRLGMEPPAIAPHVPDRATVAAWSAELAALGVPMRDG